MAVTRDLAVLRNDTMQFKVSIVEGMIYDDDEDETPLDVSSYSFAAQIRRSYNSDDVLAEAEFDTTDAADGEIVVRFPVSEIETLELSDDEGVWDLQITSAAPTPVVTTTHRGSVTIIDDVTRED